MGAIVILIAAVMEALFAVYSIKTKSDQKKSRSRMDIGIFAVFIILTLSSVIQWSFRWMLLAAILLVRAITGALTIIRNKEDKQEHRKIHVLIKATSMWLLVAAAAIPALIFPQYKLPGVTGEHEVGTAVYTYTDNSRIEAFNDKGENRRITVEFWYPEDTSGKYPLVVFSHGAFGIMASNTSTFKELASNGYVVCSVSHPYHSMYTIDAEGSFTKADQAFLQEVTDVNNGVCDQETVYKLSHKWLKLRTEDMNFVLDTIIAATKVESPDLVYQLIDTGRIGLMGHSLGGAASAQLGRERSDIKGVIDLDGSLVGDELDYKEGKYVINHDIYPVPILFVDTDTMKQAMAGVTDPDIEIPQELILDTAPNAYEVYFRGTNHLSVTDLALFSPALVKLINGSTKENYGGQGADKYQVIEKMNSIILEFFDASLKGEGRFTSEGTY
ncbi:MAG: alpha/beta hydrolase family protein [Pseudomonadota bacterium]